MNQVQVAIIALVAVVVVSILIYYIYQENKFKKMIEKNFNQATNDVLNEEHGIVLEGASPDDTKPFSSSVKDEEPDLILVETKLTQKEINFDPIFDKSPKNNVAVNSEFASFDAHEFPYSNKLNPELDHVVDIYFAKPVKIKALPDINQFTAKRSLYFILDKDSSWNKFERGNKYVVSGIKLLVDLVDSEGIVSDLQLTNIYNELEKFARHHDGVIRQLDSELTIRKLQYQMKTLANSQMELKLFIINKDMLEFRHFAKYFTNNGFINNHGVFEMVVDNKVIFNIQDENSQPFSELLNYSLFSINTKLHHQEDPMVVVNKIFDFAEHYMQYFESRLLNSNKHVVNEKEYLTLERQINSYTHSCKRQGILLGSDLVIRGFP